MLASAKGPLVVGVVHSAETLRAAMDLAAPPAAPDWLELRVDGFTLAPESLDALALASPRPLLVTVRRADEGGMAPALDSTARQRLYARFLPVASAVDVEVRSLCDMSDTLAAARAHDCAVVASFHDFGGTPPLAILRAAAERARTAGGEVFKVATTVNTPGDLATLFALLDAEPGSAVMGMGRLGRASRPALAAAGSALNYGYLGAGAQVPGQWPVADLRARIDELI